MNPIYQESDHLSISAILQQIEPDNKNNNNNFENITREKVRNRPSEIESKSVKLCLGFYLILTLTNNLSNLFYFGKAKGKKN